MPDKIRITEELHFISKSVKIGVRRKGDTLCCILATDLVHAQSRSAAVEYICLLTSFAYYIIVQLVGPFIRLLFTCESNYQFP